MTEQGNALAVITGASSGIGRDFARALAARGLDVLVVARREDRLLALKSELEQRHNIRVFPLVADLAEEGVEQRIEQEVARLGLPLQWLVNNAGYGMEGQFDKLPLDGHQNYMKVMMTGVLELTYRLIPHLKRSAPAYIINVSSVASFMPSTPGSGVYAGIKAFVRSFSELLAVELRDFNINVTASCPGVTLTEIFDFVEDDKLRAKLETNPTAMKSMTVVEQAIDAVRKGRVVIVHGWANKIMTTVIRMSPLFVGRWIAGKIGALLDD